MFLCISRPDLLTQIYENDSLFSHRSSPLFRFVKQKQSFFFFLIYLVGQDLSSGMWELVP